MKTHVVFLNSCVSRKIEQERVIARLKRDGYRIVSEQDAEICILWTCGFRADAMANSISEARRLSDAFGPDNLTITGCAVAIQPESFQGLGKIETWADAEANMPAWDGGCWRACEYGPTFTEKFHCVTVSRGCTHKCAYCSERLAFPPYKSLPPDRIIEDIQRLGAGRSEVMLIADSIGEYGRDIGLDLPHMIQGLLDRFSQIKLAFFGLNPDAVLQYRSDFERWFAAGRLGHLHIPIQSGNSDILARMRRGYTTYELLSVFNLLMQYHHTDFETHVIIGFPGETDEQFQDTLDIIMAIHPRYVLGSSCMLNRRQVAEIGEPCPGAVMERRAEQLTALCRQEGILCNVEGSEFSQRRIKEVTCERQAERVLEPV